MLTLFLCTMIWKKWREEDLKKRVFEALEKNVNYMDEDILGVPASHLDQRVFNHDAPFLKEAPFLSTLIKNPNHIGCHTITEGEPFFAGTHEIEKETIRICSEDILKAEENSCDGYVAAGGTEANIQAIWIYRNYYQNKGFRNDQIAILTSKDAHYSMDKASNLLGLQLVKVGVDPETRKIDDEQTATTINQLAENGCKGVIVVLNMMTTMFGSVDQWSEYKPHLQKHNLEFCVHVDGAYGGFYYPFSSDEEDLTFKNPDITSVTLDAHKMAQAPYGTGLLMVRKGWIHLTQNGDAAYVKGDDFTLSGSRSGANAIAVWMILSSYGPYSWKEKIFILQKRSQWICEQLDAMGAEYYRNPNSNIITIKSSSVSHELANEYGLVPDNHHQPSWYKIVVMEHVTIEKVKGFLEKLDKELKVSSAL